MTKKQEQQRWQADEDAYTIARYNEIMSNKGRAQRAVKAARDKAAELQKQASLMKSATISRDGIIYNKSKK